MTHIKRKQFDDHNEKQYLSVGIQLAAPVYATMSRVPLLTEKTIKAKIARYNRRKIQDDSLTRSAVLVPIVESLDGLELLFTKRTQSVEHHKGQISFPGGAADPSDKSLIETALRESSEEIGLTASEISVLGVMDDLQTPSGFVVTPVIGFLHHRPAIHLNADEVAEVIFIPLEKFFDDSLRRSEVRERRGVPVEVYFYDVWKEPVWGATALFVKRLVDLLRAK
ncbi:MAG TPA: CoA pyrophosphatase [Bacteroidota bacterium]|nr:CoA pyrophosphatase [Bacteroidota bacterium]